MGTDGRSVALKLFHKPKSPAFQKELAALLRVGAHPHVVRLLECYQNDLHEDVLVLELFDCDLYELYRQWFYHTSSLLDRLIARIIGQLLEALDHLRTRGIAHRDIKLENIMIYNVNDVEAMVLKLGDFGWAGLADSDGQFDLIPKVCGTLCTPHQNLALCHRECLQNRQLQEELDGQGYCLPRSTATCGASVLSPTCCTSGRILSDLLEVRPTTTRRQLLSEEQ
jgi:serine/threonine protein kinase